MRREIFTYQSKSENRSNLSGRVSFLNGAFMLRFESTRSQISPVLKRVNLRATSPVLTNGFISKLNMCNTCPLTSENKNLKNQTLFFTVSLPRNTMVCFVSISVYR